MKNFLICFIIQSMQFCIHADRDAPDIRLSAGLVGSGLLQSGHSGGYFFWG